MRHGSCDLSGRLSVNFPPILCSPSGPGVAIGEVGRCGWTGKGGFSVGAARPESDKRARGEAVGSLPGWGVGSWPDDGVPNVVELRCAGCSGSSRREPVGCGGDHPGGGEGGKRAAPNEADWPSPVRGCVKRTPN
jgi:hypothetical protein